MAHLFLPYKIINRTGKQVIGSIILFFFMNCSGYGFPRYLFAESYENTKISVGFARSTAGRNLDSDFKQNPFNIEVARGERECFQVILFPKIDIPDVRVIFKVEGDKETKSEGIKISWNTVAFKATAQSGNLKILYPDILLNKKNINLQRSRDRIIWINIDVSQRAQPGHYRLIGEIFSGNENLAEFDIPLKVLEFELPEQLPIVIQGNIWFGYLFKWLKLHDFRDDSRVVMTKHYLNNLAGHRCNAIPNFWPYFPSKEWYQLASFTFEKLHFKYFRFPAGMVASGIGSGKWQGRGIIMLPHRSGEVWINAYQFKRKSVPSTATRTTWVRDSGMRLNIGRSNDPNKFDGSWLEYEFETEQPGWYRIWTIGRHKAIEEIWIDGNKVGRVPKGGRGIGLCDGNVNLYKGKYRLRVVFRKLQVPYGDILQRIFISRNLNSDVKKLLNAAKFNPDFLGNYLLKIRKNSEAIQKIGLIDKCILKIWDEPSPQACDLVHELYEKAKNILPNIKTECTKLPNDDLAGPIDIWTFPGETNPAKELLDKEKRKGKKLWLYYNSLHDISSPPANIRAIGWLLWRFQLDGYHFWCLNYWKNDPLNELVSSSNFHYGGTLIYPDPTTGNPLNSIRWENFRDGLDDYLCLLALEKKVSELKNKFNRTIAQKEWIYDAKIYLNLCREIFNDFTSWKKKKIDFVSLRHKANELMERVPKQKIQ